MATKKRKRAATKKPRKATKRRATKKPRKATKRRATKRPTKRRARARAATKAPTKRRAKKRATKKPAKKRSKIAAYHGALHDHHDGTLIRNAHAHEAAAAKRTPHGVIVIGRRACVVRHPTSRPVPPRRK